MFAPERSLVRRRFLDQVPRWICQLPAVHEEWGDVLHILDNPDGHDFAVAFSPNGRMLASAGVNGLRLSDPITGSLLGSLAVDAHQYRTDCTLLFSPTGRYIAYCSPRGVMGQLLIHLFDTRLMTVRQSFECYANYGTRYRHIHVFCCKTASHRFFT